MKHKMKQYIQIPGEQKGKKYKKVIDTNILKIQKLRHLLSIF